MVFLLFSTWGQADTLHSNPARIGREPVFAKTMSSPSASWSLSTSPLSSLPRRKTSLSRGARLVVFPQVARIIRLRSEFAGRESTSTNNSVSGEQAGGWWVRMEYIEGWVRNMLCRKRIGRRRNGRSRRKQILNLLIPIS